MRQQGITPAVIPGMTAVVLPVSTPRLSAQSPRRFAFALAASAFCHLLLATVLTLEAPRRDATPQAGALLHVRLEMDTAPATPAASLWLDTGARPTTPTDKERVPAPRDRERAAPARQQAQEQSDAAAPLALPQVPDPTYYAARELDAYPRPLAPLSFDHPERAARESRGGRLLLQLLIDEHGTVREVSVVEAEPAGYFEDAARTVLTAARFAPAVKDGRAVKSRLLLSLSFGPAREKTVNGDHGRMKRD